MEILLDCGPFASLYGIDGKYIFISHSHSDHISGLLNLLYMKYYRNKLQNLKIYAPPDTCLYISELISLSFNKGVINSCSEIEIKPFLNTIQIKDILCHPLKTFHRCESTGFVFTTGEEILLTYTSDTNSDILTHPYVTNAKHLMIETTYLEKENISKAYARGHMALPELNNFVHKFKGEKIYPFHFLEAYKTDDIYSAIKKMKLSFLFKPVGLTI